MKTMTQTGLQAVLRRTLLALVVILSSFLGSVRSFAQSVPEKVEVDVNTGGDSVWYGQPWVWAVGVAVFIVIIVAITRNNNSRA